PGRRWRRRRRGATRREAPLVARLREAGGGPRNNLPVIRGAGGQRRQVEALRLGRRLARTEREVRGEERRVWCGAEVDIVGLRPEPAVPRQSLPRGSDADGAVGDRPVRRLVGRQRHERLRLLRADRAQVVPLPLELVGEKVEDERL